MPDKNYWVMLQAIDDNQLIDLTLRNRDIKSFEVFCGSHLSSNSTLDMAWEISLL
jgi:hypothetical protein